MNSSYDANTMAGTWATDDVYVNPLTEQQYLIIVVDENWNPIPGATVTYDNQSDISGADGRVYFNAFSYREPVITVSKNGYMAWSNENIYWEKSSSGMERIILYPESAGNLKLISARYSNRQYRYSCRYEKSQPRK